jgi:hypothetical protein
MPVLRKTAGHGRSLFISTVFIASPADGTSGALIKMTKQEIYHDYHDSFEYHGSTVIERTRNRSGTTIRRDWILFDSVEEAAEYFYTNCGESGQEYIH